MNKHQLRGPSGFAKKMNLFFLLFAHYFREKSDCTSRYSQTRQRIKISFGAAVDISIVHLLVQTASKSVHPKKKGAFLSAKKNELFFLTL